MKYEEFHGVRYEYDVLVATTSLSKQYIRSFPCLTQLGIELILVSNALITLFTVMYFLMWYSDVFLLNKAIDVIDEASSRVQLTQMQNSPKKGIITTSDIHLIISMRTWIPVENVSQVGAKRLMKLEETLHKRIVGQHEAVEAISRATRILWL